MIEFVLGFLSGSAVTGIVMVAHFRSREKSLAGAVDRALELAEEATAQRDEYRAMAKMLGADDE